MSDEARTARWNAFTIALHWVAAAMILELVAHGWIMVHARLDAATTFDLYQWHKSLGFAALAVTAARLAARLALPAPGAPSSVHWERRLATFVQWSLYLLTIAAIAAGWLVVSTSPLPVPTRFFDLFVIPNVARPDAALFASAVLAHKFIAWAIADFGRVACRRGAQASFRRSGRRARTHASSLGGHAEARAGRSRA